LILTIISYIAMACSLLGNFYVNRKKVLGMWIWAFGSSLWIIYAISTQTWSQLIMFTVYTVFNIEGIIKWTKSHKRKEKLNDKNN
jgi:membrane protein implicated in regulation of membrane protease activity